MNIFTRLEIAFDTFSGNCLVFKGVRPTDEFVDVLCAAAYNHR